jgi:hypothetical protein
MRRVAPILIVACAFTAAATGPDPVALVAVEVMDTTLESCRIMLTLRGQVSRVKTTNLKDGRFLFDLEPVAWAGPTRRMSPEAAGIHEYRYSQFSRDPLVTRLVVEVNAGWSCRHEPAPGGLVVICSGPPVAEAQSSAPVGPTIAVARGTGLMSPLSGLDAEDLVDRSLGYTPRDIVRDGLPHFGAVRDDWMGAPRPHKGLDIYVDNVPVQAAAKGKITGVGFGERAGGWAKIDHGNGVETVYVHVSRLTVEAGDDVVRGQRIATVDGAAGNAVEPQLHFELRLDGESVDPVQHIFELASEDLRRKITRENRRLEALSEKRASRVQQMPHQ